MATKSINITIDEELLAKLDVFVSAGRYPNRSRSIEDAIKTKLKELDEEAIGEQAKLLNKNESEEWFEGELKTWQEKY